ncbi:Uncharacterised protein [Mycobacteroides abscessus subsp. abscessus]|nr:Uncharacterised protein [Mycobacteroides abscessus subsp. abscessus]
MFTVSMNSCTRLLNFLMGYQLSHKLVDHDFCFHSRLTTLCQVFINHTLQVIDPVQIHAIQVFYFRIYITWYGQIDQ